MVQINKTNLQLQLGTFAANLTGTSTCNNFTDIQDQLLQISPAERKLMDEITTIIKLIMVMPMQAVRDHLVPCVG